MRSPWAWLRDIFARRRGEDPVQHQRYFLPYPVSGVRLTDDEALSLSTVWACIDAIAKGIASCKWNVFQPLGNGKRELLEDDALAWVLNTRPNPEMTAIGFREALLYTAIPFGNSYAEIVRDGGARVAELWPMEESRVTPRRDPGTWALFYEYRQPDGSVVRLEQRQVFHLRGPGLNGLLGENIIARAAKTLSVAAAQERYSASFFGNGANPGGVLEMAGLMSEEQHARLKADWAEKKQGPENAHRPLILENGVKWTSTAIDPQKSQMTESKQFSVEEICRWFGVPPHKVQHLLRATFSNIEHQGMEFVRDACTPWARRLEQEADYKLFRQDRGPWRYTCIDTSPLSAGDSKSRAEANAINRQNGIKTANEIRAEEGLNDLGPEGDVLLVQSNLTTVENIINPPKPSAPALPAPRADDDEEDDDAEDQAAESYNLVREAVVALFASAYENYAHRAAARRASLGAQPVKLEAERSKLLARLASDCAPGLTLARKAGLELAASNVDAWAERLDAGEPPVQLAAALLAQNPQPQRTP